MIRFQKFRQELFGLVPAREIVHKPGPGKGWPEECPPIRAGNGFGFDVLANFDIEFQRTGGPGSAWKVKEPVVVESDFTWAPTRRAPGVPLVQEYAWFWQRGQKLPHVISDNVYEAIKHQVKVSTFLYLESDPGEVLLITEVPNLRRAFRAMTALVETDWYPASYPWHCVLELDRSEKRVVVKKGEPLCRVIPVKRGKYAARPMGTGEFDRFFERGQQWLRTHGKMHEAGAAEGTLDITRTYVRQQKKSAFEVRA